MDAKEVTISEPPEIEIESPPPRFAGAALSESKLIRFRCPFCGIAHSAAVLPQSPQIAKFKCRQCDHVIEVQTRESAMDALEDEFKLRLDMKDLAERKKAFSFPRGKR